MRPLQIAFVHPNLGIGGAERLVVDTALALQQRGHRVAIYTLHHDPAHCFAETRDGTLDVRVVRPWLPAAVGGRLHIACTVLRSLALARRVATAREQFDVLFVDQLSAPIPLLKHAHAHIFFYCHFPDYVQAPHATWAQRLYRAPFDALEAATTGEADMVAVNSRFTQAAFAQAFPGLPLPRVLAPALNLAAYDTPPPPPRDPAVAALRSPRRLVLSINRFERKKGLRLAIDAAALLPRDVCLVVAGGWDVNVRENTDHLRELVAHARALGLSTRVIAPRAASERALALLPSDAERLPAFADADAPPPPPVDVLFVPSFSEGQRAFLLAHAQCVVYTPANEHLGIVPLEAMYMRVPVVAVDSGGPRETVVHGETGYLCEPSPDHFAEAIARVLAAPVDQRRAMGDAGRARVLQHFSLDAYADKLEALFETMFEYPPAVSAVLGVLMTLFIVGTSAVVILVLVLVS
ncbi:Alpha-1,3-mannosyltransferase-like protein [Coemansia sp. RSA 2711]|nr:Alpha-1,3-mannosyltransferase-like protein [Coemansia sp. RSA 2711]KAJ2307851.1 Alpha-1,3-mannosyltransferase-like protein [Coemansia sp. RSA 2705]KAJ2315665.1 Alpha-1,3-mannosyltransferase-like protein [Coemansia sp. RSA 2704]KAJ2363909.1 Alpha-1,3-mannosyltransferase-like protein [Coemansia sp. RSA 2610]KAJ2723753.1 Alpha-1,3-mannosyltransferase-like protein [Coemansia sp. Cherry 401B]